MRSTCLAIVYRPKLLNEVGSLFGILKYVCDIRAECDPQFSSPSNYNVPLPHFWGSRI